MIGFLLELLREYGGGILLLILIFGFIVINLKLKHHDKETESIKITQSVIQKEVIDTSKKLAGLGTKVDIIYELLVKRKK